MPKSAKSFLLRLLFLAFLAGMMIFLVARETPCLIRKYTGLLCPTCGMSRAWLAAFRWDFSAAFSYHPMFWSIPVLGMTYLLDGTVPKIRWISRWLYVGIFVGFVLCYLIRLLVFLGGAYTC